MKKILLLLAVSLFVVVGCEKKPDGPGGGGGSQDQFITKMKTEGLFANNAALFTKNLELYQESVNALRLTYRLQSDNQVQYVSIKLGAKVDAVGGTTTIAFQTSGIERVTLSNDTYPVELVQIKDGLAWYWNAEQAIGFVIPKF